MSLELLHSLYDQSVNGKERETRDAFVGIPRSRVLVIFDEMKRIQSDNLPPNTHVHAVALMALKVLEEDQGLAYIVGEAFLHYQEAEAMYDRSLTAEIQMLIRGGSERAHILNAIQDIHSPRLRQKFIDALRDDAGTA